MPSARFSLGIISALLWLTIAFPPLFAQQITSSGDARLPLLPDPAPDVLRPNRRSTSPDVKLGLRFGFNRSRYTNDRYLDNTLLDVGQSEGEIDVYSSAAGFGYSAGIDIEYPTSPGFSWALAVEYTQIQFRASGPVSEPCEKEDGTIVQGSSFHEFIASANFVKVAPHIKLNFSTWYLLAGLAGEHPLSSSLERTRRLGQNDCFYPGTDHLGTIVDNSEIPAMQGLHYALRLGGGLIYHLSERVVFSPELTMDFGWSRLNKSPNSDIGIYTISATLRYDMR